MSNPHTAEFETRFRDFYPRLQLISRKYSKLSGVAVEEFISGLSEAFWQRYQDYDVTRLDNFQSYMQTTLTQEALRIANRKEKQYQRMTTSVDAVIEEHDGENDVMPEAFVDPIAVDKLITNRLYIESLLDGEDKLTKEIVSEKLANPDESNRYIAEQVGVHHATVATRLKKLGEKARKEVAKR